MLSCLQPSRLPLLEQLSITVPFTRHLPEHVLKFPPSPHLKVVEIKAVGKSSIFFTLPSFLALRVQWDNVTHLTAESLTVHQCFAFLHLVPQLAHCNFHNVIVHNQINSLPEPLILSPLKYLSLSYYRRSPHGSFLDRVVLPSLETLILFYVSSLGSLMDFLERSACSLRTLSFQHLNIKRVDSLIPLLQFLSPKSHRTGHIPTSETPNQKISINHYQNLHISECGRRKRLSVSPRNFWIR